MTPIRRAPLAEQAADELLARIRSGEWALGAKLPGETTLAPQLGVGRSTVREAIRDLAGRGVLEPRQGAGVFVTALDAPDEWDAVLRRADIVSVLEARLAIESEAAALAAERRTPAQLRAIRRALTTRGATTATDSGTAAPSASIGAVETHVDADTAFHRAIVEASGNAILLELFDGFVPRVRTAMVDMLRLRGGHGDAEDHAAHERMCEAIATRDAALAASLSRDHLTTITESLR